MTEDQGSVVILILRELVEEVTRLRSDFEKFTSYSTVGAQEIIDGITGTLGYNIGDLHDRMNDVTSALGDLESAIDLK